jgi:hypothetical protein
MDPRNPDEVVHRALRRLPTPRAPSTLAPRVMTAIADRDRAPLHDSRPWTWFTWPLVWKAASIAALVVLAAGLAWLQPRAGAYGILDGSLSAAAAAAGARIVALRETAAAVVSVTSIVWEAFLQPIVGYVLVWIVLMSAACAAFGAAVGRVALGGPSHS